MLEGFYAVGAGARVPIGMFQVAKSTDVVKWILEVYQDGQFLSWCHSWSSAASASDIFFALDIGIGVWTSPQ